MSMTAYWTVRARLLQVPGVANVTLWGERLQMLQVQVRPDAMAERNISLNQVMETTAEAVDSGLLLHDEGSIIGPAASSRRPTSGSTCAPCCRSSRPTTWRTCRSRPVPRRAPTGRPDRPARRRRRRRRGPPAAARRRRGQRRPRPDAHRREAAVGRHRRAHPRASRRSSRTSSRACPASGSTPRCSSRRTSSRPRSTTSATR